MHARRKKTSKGDREVTGMADRMGGELTDKQCGGNDKLITDGSKEQQQRHKPEGKVYIKIGWEVERLARRRKNVRE